MYPHTVTDYDPKHGMVTKTTEVSDDRSLFNAILEICFQKYIRNILNYYKGIQSTTAIPKKYYSKPTKTNRLFEDLFIPKIYKSTIHKTAGANWTVSFDMEYFEIQPHSNANGDISMINELREFLGILATKYGIFHNDTHEENVVFIHQPRRRLALLDFGNASITPNRTQSLICTNGLCVNPNASHTEWRHRQQSIFKTMKRYG